MTLRLGIVTNYYVPELGVNTYYLCRELGRLGVDVTLFCSDRYGKKKPEARFAKGEIEEPFHVVRVSTAFSIANVPLMYGLEGRIKKEGPFDLIQTEDAYQLYSWSAARTSKRLKIPLVLRHDLSAPPSVEPWRTAYKIVIEKMISPPILDRASRAIVPTKGARAYLGRLRPELPITIVPFGIDTTEFTPSKTESQSQKFEILTVARLIREKGIIELMYAFKEFRKTVPNSRLTLIGRGPLYKEMVMLAGSLGVIDGLLVKDQVRHDEIYRYYQACDMFVLPSYEEAPGISIMEAMSCGKPVVATRIPGVMDTIDDGIDGIMVSPRDAVALSHAMVMVYNEVQSGVHTIGNNARAKIVSKFDWGVLAHKMIDEYRHVLDGQAVVATP